MTMCADSMDAEQHPTESDDEEEAISLAVCFEALDKILREVHAFKMGHRHVNKKETSQSWR